jgi:hypothetical protein
LRKSEVGMRKRKKVRSWEGEKVGELDEHGAKGIAGKENWTKCKKLKWECGSGRSECGSGKGKASAEDR